MTDMLFSIVVPALNEESNITILLESVFKQSYRPIEVIVVDGGSVDRTSKMVAQRASEWNNQDLGIVLVKELSHDHRSAAHARNMGISESHGNYVLIVDSDFVLSNTDILNELAVALRNHETACFRTVTLKDTWLEQNLALDSQEPIFRGPIIGLSGIAFRREALIGLRFDDMLGFGDDIDFRNRMRKANVPSPVVVSAVGARHRPRTLSELRRQRSWYGRTAPLWLSKNPSLMKAFEIAPVAPIVLLALSILLLFKYGIVGLLPLVAFFAIPVTVFLRSAKRSAGRFLYLTFVRYIYAPFCFSLGLAEGVVERIVRGRIDPSRRA
jgi:glycosyltransferase involved in cell wall biosynthesis